MRLINHRMLRLSWSRYAHSSFGRILALRLNGRISCDGGFYRRPFLHRPLTTTRALYSHHPSEEQVIHDPFEPVRYEGVEEPAQLPPVVLRPYQEQAIQACLDGLSSGLRRIGVSSPTGSGKTTMFMNLIPRVTDPAWNISNSFDTPAVMDDSAEERRGQGGSEDEGADDSVLGMRRRQTLIVVNGVELALQAEAAGKRLLPPDWTVEIEQSTRKATGFADVTIATFQTLLNTDRLTKFGPERFGLVIVDEAHHAASKSYLRLLHYFNRDVKLPRSIEPVTTRDHPYQTPIIGFTATFSRHDQMALSDVFEEIVFHRDVQSMLKEGWLCSAHSTYVKADLGLDEVAINPMTGDYSAPSLAKRLDTPEIRELVVRTYLHLADSRRSTLVFCTNLTHVFNLVDTFRAAGVDARSVSSDQHSRERHRIMNEFKAGDFPVLVNCEVLTEGADIPQIDCVILARPTKSKNLLVQMVGRGLRRSPDTNKEDCHIIDIVDNVSRGLTASPTLFGLSYEDIEGNEMDNEDTERSPAERPERPSVDGEPAGAVSPVKKVTLVDEDDPFNVSRKEPRVVQQMTFNAWVACGEGVFVLEMFSQDHVRIQPQASGRGYTVHYTYRKLPVWIQNVKNVKPYKASRQIAEAENLANAFKVADAFIEKISGRAGALHYRRDARWRFRPASQKALDMLYKLKGVEIEESDPEDEDEEGEAVELEKMVRIGGKQVALTALNAGQVASTMTALKHGAKGRARREEQKRATRRKKIQRKKEKEAALAARNLPLPPSS